MAKPRARRAQSRAGRRRPYKSTRAPRRKRFMSSRSHSSGGNSDAMSSQVSESDVSSMCSEDRGKGGRSYARIKAGVRKSIPAAVVLYAFRKLDSSNGLTSRRIVNFLKERFELKSRGGSQNVGKSIGKILRNSVEFGVLEKIGTRFFLASRRQRARSSRSKTRHRSKRDR